MKRTTALAFALALTTATGVKAADDSPQPEVAVLRAENRAQNPWWTEVGAERTQDALIARLAKGYGNRVMPRADLVAILADNRLWLTGELTPAGALRVGRELGVRYLVVTTLVEFGTGARKAGRKSGRKLLGLGGPKKFNTEIILRLIETETGRTVWSDGRRAQTPLGELLSSPGEEGARVEDAVFEVTVLPMLEELAAQLSTAVGVRLLPETPLASQDGQPAAERAEQGF